MIYAGAMVIVRVAALRSIAVPMDGHVANATSGYVPGAVDATTRARNAALERKRKKTTNYLRFIFTKCNIFDDSGGLF
jgi:hypothetical protein